MITLRPHNNYTTQPRPTHRTTNLRRTATQEKANKLFVERRRLAERRTQKRTGLRFERRLNEERRAIGVKVVV